MNKINRNELRCKRCGSTQTYYAKSNEMRVCFKCGHREPQGKRGKIKG